MHSNSIRQSFIDFFVKQEHAHIASLPLASSNPNITTLFTIAGMQQMIGYFLGLEQPPNRRLVTVQRAVRTGDIEEVGDDTHLTFLEMLGNFSVGDYFKTQAVEYTWKFLTESMGIPRDRWWATIYPGDDVARDAWLAVGLARDRIGETEDNWWAAGPTGPCGPDSEIHFDRGAEFGCGSPDCRPEHECCDRFVETWNNVFIMYSRDVTGELRELSWTNIDTGMGFERLAMIVQGAPSVYDTDLFRPILQTVARLAKCQYGTDPRVDRALRIISDHSRAFTFIIMDGVMPSAEGRGYVLRRLIRRAAMHGRLLGINQPFLHETAATVIDLMGEYYTDLKTNGDRIFQVVRQEESRFLQTLSRGLSIFEEMAETAQTSGSTISGNDAFVLSDTHGLPFELTAELAREKGLDVDREGFEKALQAQQTLAQSGRKSVHRSGTSPETYVDIAGLVPATVFTGYDSLETPAEVAAIVAEGQRRSRAEYGDEIEMILTSTPFFAESGGQLGDKGTIVNDTGRLEVVDTQRPHADLVVHRCRVLSGTVAVGDTVLATVDAERRLQILPHHSGTHLLHKALQEVLGPEATQAGSLVAPDRLRFDFRWPRPMQPDEVREVQDRVNAAVWANLPVRSQAMSYVEAVRGGATALFGEKYGDWVRVVSMGDWSKELCGGTHVEATGEIGLLVITSETGIGSGVRRLEALAGAAAYAYLTDLRDQMEAAAQALETRPENLVARAQHITVERREQEKRVTTLESKLAVKEAEGLLEKSECVDGFRLIAVSIDAESTQYLEATMDAVKSRLDTGVVVLASVVNGKPALLMAVTRDLLDRGVHANWVLSKAAQSAGGKAGGKPDRARGGLQDASRLTDALREAVNIIKEKVSN